MEKTIWYRIFLIIFILVLAVAGMFIGIQLVKNEPINKKEPTIYVEERKEEVEIYEPVMSKKKYDVELIYEDYYVLCDETVSVKNIIHDTTIEDVKKDEEVKQKKNKEKYEIVEATENRIVYKRKINKYCPNHYKIMINDKENKVKIYNIEDDENITLYREVEIYKDLLRREMIKELKDGITVDNKNELNNIIEDLES